MTPRVGREAASVALIAGLALLVACPKAGGEAGPRPSAGAAEVTTASIARASTLEAVLRRKKLRVGMEAGYFPFEMKDKSGKLIGFDVEIAEAMASALGVELELLNTEWDGIIPSLDAGKFDIIMSGMTRTPQRALKVNFCDPYFETGQVLIVNAVNGAAIQSYKDLNDPSKKIAVKLGTTGDIAATKLIGSAEIHRYQTETDAAMEVNSGRADAFVYDEPFARIWNKRYPDATRAILEPFTTEHLAWAVRKGDADFVAWCNTFLADIKANPPEDPLYARVHRKYFVDMDWQGQVPE